MKCSHRRASKSAVAAGLLLASWLDTAAAQQPTAEQLGAIRQSCRSDFISNCSGVQPGGKEALECLQRNLAKISVPCQSAVNAIAPKPAAAPVAAPAAAKSPPPPAPATAAASQDEQLSAVQKACTLNDFVAHCSWIAPSSPEVLLCLQANAAQLSPNCQTVVRDLPPAATPAALAAPSAPVTTAPAIHPALAAPPKKLPEAVRASPKPLPLPAAAAAPRQPSPEQLSAIRAACRSDFISHCSGVQPGGPEALQCLERNSAQLAAPCQSAVAAIAKGASAAASAPAAAANAAAPAAAPLGPMPRLRLGEELAILRSCSADQRTLCAGIPAGGGRIIACLAQNASSLSPGCYGALAQARQ